MAAAQKPTAKATEPESAEKPATSAPDTPAGPAIDPRGLQVGEAVNAPLTTNPPRGVGEAPSNQIADEEAAASLQGHVQKVIDSEEERGYRGARRTKPVPNENYTLRGVGQGLPTPETTVVTPERHSARSA